MEKISDIKKKTASRLALSFFHPDLTTFVYILTYINISGHARIGQNELTLQLTALKFRRLSYPVRRFFREEAADDRCGNVNKKKLRAIKDVPLQFRFRNWLPCQQLLFTLLHSLISLPHNREKVFASR